MTTAFVTGASRGFDDVAAVFGPLDVFVSNATSGVLRPLSEVDEKGWAWTMDFNARAFLIGAQRAATLMPDGGAGLAA